MFKLHLYEHEANSYRRVCSPKRFNSSVMSSTGDVVTLLEHLCTEILLTHSGLGVTLGYNLGERVTCNWEYMEMLRMERRA